MAYAYPMDNRMSMMSAANYSAPMPRTGYAQPPSGSASPRALPKKAPATTQAAVAPPTGNSSNGKEPTDEQLLAEIKSILATANLMTLTKKQVREDLSARFGGQDLKPRRAAINAIIDDVLQGM
jgi:chitin synthase